MARANRGGVNKSEAVREVLAQDRNTSTKDVIATLAQRGIRVSHNLVYLAKRQARARRQKAKRQKALENSQEMGITNPVDLILEVRRLSEKSGGIKRLKKLVDVLAE